MQAADWIKIYLGLYSRYSMEWSIQKQIRFGHNKPSFQKKKNKFSKIFFFSF